MIVRKFPQKGLINTNLRKLNFSTAKLEGVLKAVKIEISQIPSTDNPPPNLTLSECKALWELKMIKTLQ